MWIDTPPWAPYSVVVWPLQSNLGYVLLGGNNSVLKTHKKYFIHRKSNGRLFTQQAPYGIIFQLLPSEVGYMLQSGVNIRRYVNMFWNKYMIFIQELWNITSPLTKNCFILWLLSSGAYFSLWGGGWQLQNRWVSEGNFTLRSKIYNDSSVAAIGGILYVLRDTYNRNKILLSREATSVG